MTSHYGFLSPPLPDGAEPIERHHGVIPKKYEDDDDWVRRSTLPPPTPPRRYVSQITIEKYVVYLDRLLGQGGTANVYLCTDIVSGELRAVKRIDKNKLDEKTLNMIIREYKIVTDLDHPNIIKFYAKIEDADYIYIFMDYYPEGDIITYEEQFAYINECTTWMIFSQVLDALVYLHEHYVIHRDIKLENILLKDSTNMLVALADFGFSEKLPENNPYIKDLKGTPIYLAPEMLTGYSYDGYKPDIWALGISLFAMVTGDMPFIGDYGPLLIHNITYDPLVFPPHVTSECRTLIRGLLTRDPENRISLYEVYDSDWYTYWKYFMSHSKCLPNPKKSPDL
jgi:serine/threonine protein kinase